MLFLQPVIYYDINRDFMDLCGRFITIQLKFAQQEFILVLKE